MPSIHLGDVPIPQDDLFLRLAEASPIGVYVIRQGVFCYVNPQFCLTTGYSKEELLGHQCLSLVLENDRELVRRSAIDMLANHRRAPYQYRVRCKDGSIRWILETVASVEYDGRAAIGNFMDVTERKLAEEAANERGRRDPLTRLLNHGAFLEQLFDAITSNAEIPHWLILADVDGLKRINDVFGHQMGDIVLRKVAAVLDRPGTIVGRYGGDEFVVLLVGGRRENAIAFCEDVRQVLAESDLADSRSKARVTPSLTMGLAGYPEDATSASVLIRAADDAMYQKKSVLA